MELSDYDILGITPKATFRIVKNAYYELSRIYHPDSTQRIASLTKEERIIAFKRITEAYENMKKKLNVVEVDLPQNDIEYKNYDLPSIERNNELNTKEEKDFHEKFNREFEKINKRENSDNPFSIHYSEPEEPRRTKNDTVLIIKEHNPVHNSDSLYEFGINYVEDHSTNKYSDVRKSNKSKITDGTEGSESTKEMVDLELDSKLEQLIKLRKEKIETNKEDLQFIEKQDTIKREIEESKRKVNEERNILLLNS